MGHGFPPLDFPLHELDGAWTGPRWLGPVEGRLGHPAVGAWLVHGDNPDPDDGRPLVMVGTFPAQRWAEHSLSGQSLRRGLAFSGALSLLRDPAGVPDLDRVADGVDDWPRARWTVDGREVTAHVHGGGDDWVGVTTDLPGLGLLVRVRATDIDGLHLVEVRDGAPYHVDLAAPIEYAATLRRSQVAALGPESWPDEQAHE